MIEIDKILFRCSSLGSLMTEGKNQITDKQLETITKLEGKRSLTTLQQEELERLIKKRDFPSLSVTCTSKLRKIHRGHKYGREEQMTNKYVTKGLREEESSITLLSLVKNLYIKKNKERLSNAFITGEPDIILRGSQEGFDIKTSWDFWTFPDKASDLEFDYLMQAHGYMALTGAKKWTIAYTLVNCSASDITKEKLNLFYSMGCPDDSDEEYTRRRIEIEKNMIFDMERFRVDNPVFDLDCKDWTFDIPREDRLVEFVVPRDEQVIRNIYERVKECRIWMKDNLK